MWLIVFVLYLIIFLALTFNNSMILAGVLVNAWMGMIRGLWKGMANFEAY